MSPRTHIFEKKKTESVRFQFSIKKSEFRQMMTLMPIKKKNVMADFPTKKM